MSTDPSTEGTELKPQAPATTPTDASTDPQPKLTSEQKKAQILGSFEERLDKGEITMDELESRQPWAAETIKAKREQAKEVLPDTSKLKSEVKSEVMEEIMVQTTLDQVQAIATKAQKEEFEATVAELEADGIGKAKAISIALKASKIDLSSQTAHRRSLSHPSFGSGDAGDKPRVTEDDRRMAAQMGVDPETVTKNRIAVEAKSFKS